MQGPVEVTVCGDIDLDTAKNLFLAYLGTVPQRVITSAVIPQPYSSSDDYSISTTDSSSGM
jgi:hypothetical protein